MVVSSVVARVTPALGSIVRNGVPPPGFAGVLPLMGNSVTRPSTSSVTTALSTLFWLKPFRSADKYTRTMVSFPATTGSELSATPVRPKVWIPCVISSPSTVIVGMTSTRTGNVRVSVPHAPVAVMTKVSDDGAVTAGVVNGNEPIAGSPGWSSSTAASASIRKRTVTAPAGAASQVTGTAVSGSTQMLVIFPATDMDTMRVAPPENAAPVP